MTEQIITIFCIVDDVLKSVDHKDDLQAKMKTSEVITTALVAAKFFGGVYEKARMFLWSHGYFKHMLNKGRFSVRLRRVENFIWQAIMTVFKKAASTQEFIIDSFPIPVCKNVRITKEKRFKSSSCRAYNASKKEYFYGIKVHLLTTQSGVPIEFFISYGSMHDMKAFKRFTLNIPAHSTIYADAAYNDYTFEETLQTERNIVIAAKRRKNAKKKCVIDQKKQQRKPKIKTRILKLSKSMRIMMEIRSKLLRKEVENLKINLRVAGLSNSRTMIFDETGLNLKDWKMQLANGEKASLQGFFESAKALNLRNSIFVDVTVLKQQIHQTYIIHRIFDMAPHHRTPSRKAYYLKF